jgi:hypothetical protein
VADGWAEFVEYPPPAERVAAESRKCRETLTQVDFHDRRRCFGDAGSCRRGGLRTRLEGQSVQSRRCLREAAVVPPHRRLHCDRPLRLAHDAGSCRRRVVSRDSGGRLYAGHKSGYRRPALEDPTG